MVLRSSIKNRDTRIEGVSQVSSQTMTELGLHETLASTPEKEAESHLYSGLLNRIAVLVLLPVPQAPGSAGGGNLPIPLPPHPLNFSMTPS